MVCAFDAVRQLANYKFWDWLADEAKKPTVNKPFYNIAEHIPKPHTVVELYVPIYAYWHGSFRYFVMPYFCGEEFELEKLKEVLPKK